MNSGSPQTEKKVFFISDIHLGLESFDREWEKESKLVSLLALIREQASSLFIVGDLFDYWFEYRRVIQKGFFRTFTALRSIIENKIPIHYIIGNHDFMHRDFFEKQIGVRLIPDYLDVTFGSSRFFIAHGDGYVANDRGYNILKKFMRNRFLQWTYSLIHPDFGIAVASKSSKKSRDFTTGKNYGEADGLRHAAEKKIDGGFDYVIFGHLHSRQFYRYKNGTYVNLGSWLDNPCYGVFFNNTFEIVDW